MEREHFDVGSGPRPGMSAGVRAGPLLYMAGQVALDGQGRLVGEGDAARQAEQCFANVEAILAKAGGTAGDIVELTCYLADPAHAAAYLGLRARLFPERAPATTTVVAALLDPRFLIEIRAIALIGSASAGR